VDDRRDAELRALMVAYQQGHIEAFDELYVKLRLLVRRFVMTQARDAAWVDDLVQETFLQVHRARRTYDAAYPVEPWVIAIARNTYLMSRRTRTRRRDFDDHHAAELDRVVVRGHEGPCIARNRLHDGLSALPPGMRRAVVMRLGLGFSVDEVSQSLGVAKSALAGGISRAVARLRRQLNTGGRR
jgi:RNA polymerase sigma-70 factor (ECF subfamily)